MKQTSLIYIEKDDSYLMLHRIKKINDENHDKWIGIGGKFENGESPEDCVMREALEETGLTLNKIRYCGIITFVSDIYGTEYMHLFHSDDFRGEIKECDEGELEWVKISSLPKLDLWEGDYIFLDLLKNKSPFFSLKLIYQGDSLKEAYLNMKKIR